MRSEAKKRADLKYAKRHVKQISLKLNDNTDRDILDRLAQEDNVQGYIKALIRADIGGPR